MTINELIQRIGSEPIHVSGRKPDEASGRVTFYLEAMEHPDVFDVTVTVFKELADQIDVQTEEQN
jgi:hypothetical protein